MLLAVLPVYTTKTKSIITKSAHVKFLQELKTTQRQRSRVN